MWLRQVAPVARDLDPVVDRFGNVLGLKVAYRDSAVGVFGLVVADGAVRICGTDFSLARA